MEIKKENTESKSDESSQTSKEPTPSCLQTSPILDKKVLPISHGMKLTSGTPMISDQVDGWGEINSNYELPADKLKNEIHLNKSQKDQANSSNDIDNTDGWEDW